MKPTMQIRTRTTQGSVPQRFARFLLLCFILTLTGCDSTPEAGPGTLAVTLSASGEDQPLSFTVRVAGTLKAEEFGRGRALFFSNLPSGDHEVLLLNINANCEVQGENPRTVTIPDGGTAQTRFDLSCVQAPRVGRIAFCSERDGLETIYVMNEDGTGVRRLIAGFNFDPHWSPDGRSIAFAENLNGSRWISVMTASGFGQKRLGPGNNEPRWSPDGQRIAFSARTSVEATEFDIWVMNADGTGLVNLTQNGRVGNGWVSSPFWYPVTVFDWSPDGQHIATWYDGEIYIYNSDGSGRRKLTDGSSAAWSPIGQQIAFKDGSRLNVINADGTGLFRLTPPFGPNSNVFNPTWSPDGTRIAFRTVGDGTTGLYVINADGTNLVKLLDDGASSESIQTIYDWSPDGTRIVFHRGGDLQVINADGTGDLVNLTNDPGGACCAHWQMVPDIR